MSEKCTKNDIVNDIYKQGRYERQEILAIIDCFINELKNSLSEGKTIELRGFGTLEPRLRKREVARNPKTGEIVTVDPHYVATFRAGQELKNNLWNLKIEDEK